MEKIVYEIYVESCFDLGILSFIQIILEGKKSFLTNIGKLSALLIALWNTFYLKGNSKCRANVYIFFAHWIDVDFQYAIYMMELLELD